MTPGEEIFGASQGSRLAEIAGSLGALLGSADAEPKPAAAAPQREVPASGSGRSLRDLFTQPRRAAGNKRSQPGADLPKSVPEPPADELGALRWEVSLLRTQVTALMGRLDRRGAFPAGPPQPDPQQRLQELQSKAEQELQRLQEEIRCHVASTQQTFQSQEKELYSALRHDFEADLQGMRGQVSRLDRQSRCSNIIVHAPTDCSQQQLLDRCNALLQPHAAARPLVSAALQPVRTRSTKHKLWRVQMQGERAKHALFRHSSSLRQDRIYLDDDLTHQQMEGRRALDTRRLQLKAAGHKTWWRRDVLHWADDDGVHDQRPSQP